jgi:hypothetical protein
MRALSGLFLILMICAGPLRAAAFDPDWGTLGVFSAATNCAQCHRASTDQDAAVAPVMRYPASDSGTDISPPALWRHSVMAHAFDDPYYRAAVEDEATVLPGLAGFIEDKCLTCHAPMARTHAHMAGVDLVQDASCPLADGCYRMATAELQDPARAGISCTLCHQVRDAGLGTPASFSGGFQIAAPGDVEAMTLYGPYQNPHQGGATLMFNTTGYTPQFGQQMTGSGHCASCHTLYTPVVDIDTGTATGAEFLEQGPFLEWQNSVYTAGGAKATECQGCHMPDPDPGLYRTRIAVRPDGAVNAMWPERSPFFTHTMAGGNTYLLELLRDNRVPFGIDTSTTVAGFDAQIAATRNLLQTATDLAISRTGIVNDTLTVDVRVANRTGHKFPTSFPSRRAWVHLTVRDATGRAIFESGAADANGRISTDAAHLAAGCLAPDKPAGFDSSVCYEPHRDVIDDPAQVAVYEAVLGDTNAAITYILLYADAYLKDNRLPPEGFTTAQAGAIEPQTLPVGTAGDADFNRAGGAEGSGTDTVHYRVALAGTSEPYTVDAELLFQSVRPGFVYGLSSNTTRVNDFKTLYQNQPPTVETLASDSAVAGVPPVVAGGGGGGCSLGGAGRFDPLWPGLLLAALAGLARRRRA